MTGTTFFEHVADALAGFLPPELRGFRSRRTSGNLKAWYGEDAREHYETQFLSRHALRAAKLVLDPPVLEIGFHAEHRDAERNDEVLAALAARERAWRKPLGKGPQAGAFIGHATPWRRLSEVWEGPNLISAETATEAAERLADYIRVLEPLRRSR